MLLLHPGQAKAWETGDDSFKRPHFGQRERLLSVPSWRGEGRSLCRWSRSADQLSHSLKLRHLQYSKSSLGLQPPVDLRSTRLISPRLKAGVLRRDTINRAPDAPASVFVVPSPDGMADRSDDEY